MKYPVNEIFLSHQGEGYNQGKKVIFLRLAKCNLACSFCDTDFEHGKEKSIDEIMADLAFFQQNTVSSDFQLKNQEYDKQKTGMGATSDKDECKSVLLTGGEPTIYDLKPLLLRLKKEKYWVGIESNGTFNFDPIRDLLSYITISPKQHAVGQKTDELRVVNTNIGLNQLAHYESMFKADHYYVSPVEINGKMNIMNTMELVGRANEQLSVHWNISIQLHKLAGIK